MAEHKVQLPDNSVITIEGPDDATDQELIDAASKHYSSKQSKPAASAESEPVTAPTVQSVTDSARNMDPMTYGASAAAGVGVLAGAKLLKDKFFGAEKPGQSTQRIEPQMDVSQKKPSEPFLEPETQTVRPKDWESSLSAEDRQLLERSRANAAVKAVQPAPVATPAGGNVVPQAQIPAAAQPAPVAPPAPVVEAPLNPKLPALLQPPAGAAPPPVVAPAIAEPVATPVLPTTPIKTDNPLITAAQAAPVAETIEAPKVKPPKAPKIQTEEQRIAGAKNWFVSHFGGQADPQAHAAYDRLVNEVLKGKPPMMGPGGGVPPEFNEFKKWYETNLQGPTKPSREALKAAISSVPRGAAAPPSLRPNEIGQGGGSLIRSLTDPLQLKQ